MKEQISKKGNSGITLIALVITIIVLLILAGIVIASLTGENGILNRAASAKENTNRQNFIEQVQLAILEKKTDLQRDLTDLETLQILSEYFKDIPTTEESTLDDIKDSQLTAQDKYGGQSLGTFTLAEMLKGKTSAGGDTTPSSDGVASVEDIGDYVTGNVVSLGISGENGTNTEQITDWRIFYVNENGTYIIASDYVPLSNEYLISALDQIGWSKTGTYSSSGLIPNALADTVVDNNASIFLNGWTSTKWWNGKTAACLLNTSKWSGFVTENIQAAGGKAIGGPTIELYSASWNARTYATGVHTRIKYETDSNYGYYIGLTDDDTSNITTTTIDVAEDAGYGDTLYYPHLGKFGDAWGYWLSSPSAEDQILNLRNYTDGQIKSVGCSNTGSGLRPVVFLPSSVQLTEENNIWTVGN